MFNPYTILLSLTEYKYARATLLKGHECAINCLSFSTTATLLASGGDDEEVKIWDIATFKSFQTLADPTRDWGQITCIEFLDLNSGTGTEWLCWGTGRGRILVYRRNRKAINFSEVSSTHVFETGDGSVESLAFDAKHQCLAVTSHFGKIKMYKFNLGKISELWSLEVADAIPRAIFFSENGRDISVYGLESGAILCSDAETSTERYTKNLDSSIGSVGTCRTTGYTVVDNMEDGFDLYPPNRTTPAQRFKTPTAGKYIKGAAFGEQGKIVICGSDHGLAYVFTPDQPGPIQKLKHGGKGEMVQVVEAASNQDSHFIATASSGTKFDICIWRMQAKKASTPQNASYSILQTLVAINVIILATLVWLTSEHWLPIANKYIILADSAISETFKSRTDSFENHFRQKLAVYSDEDDEDTPLSLADVIHRLDDASLRKLLKVEAMPVDELD